MYLGSDISNMNNVDGKECWAMSFGKYSTAAVTNVQSVFGKTWFKVYARVCYPSELWLSHCMSQGGWSPMVIRNDWEYELGSGNW